jgi:chemotaxis protein methyltransferase WspC
LDIASLGASTIERAVRQRVQACSLQDWKEYTSRVRVSEAELQALIEAVVVPETWFFRDKTAFSALVAVARGEGQPHPRPVRWRLLSAPCSTGEEPYSMVMALLDAGFALDQIQVDAWDISSQALAKARAAVYGRHSFRGQDVSFRQRHFTAVEGGHQVKKHIRQAVTFCQTNLLHPGLVLEQSAPAYDLVFCRNLMIYLERSAQDLVLRRMHSLLKPDGVLFVAPAEGGLLPRTGLGPAGLGRSFAFRKTVEPELKKSKPAARPQPGQPASPAERRETKRATTPRSSPANESAGTADGSAPQTGFTSRLDLAKHLADRGHLEEAARLCAEYLRAHGDSTEGYYLLGVIRDASGDENAAGQCYRKVLYLDPQHGEALWQLSLLAERQGDAEGASLLQKRAQRSSQPLQP